MNPRPDAVNPTNHSQAKLVDVARLLGCQRTRHCAREGRGFWPRFRSGYGFRVVAAGELKLGVLATDEVRGPQKRIRFSWLERRNRRRLGSRHGSRGSTRCRLPGGGHPSDRQAGGCADRRNAVDLGLPVLTLDDD